MSNPEEDRLRALWAATLPGPALESGDPGATVKPPDAALAGARTIASPAHAPTPIDADSPTMAGTTAGASGNPGAAGISSAETWRDGDSAGGAQGAARSEAEHTLPTIRCAGGGLGAGTGAGPKAEGNPPTYEILDEIGRGGMGVVYRARQGSLRREVAVKRSLGGASAAAREPFVAEALVTGLLDHPNIVPVHELGATADGEVFLAMKLVDGSPWSRLLHPKKDAEKARAKTLSTEDHLAILVDVCNAIAFAHEKGIVHADLKPENVMVGAFGEVVVMDWGVAVSSAGPARPRGSLVRHASEITRPCGTPAYMPPELAEGRGAEIGPATDVYLLGAILHEVITGAPPHRGARLIDVLLQAIESAPPVYGPEVPAELAGIARRAMAAAPKDRYPTAAAFQEALKAHLKHRESIQLELAGREQFLRAAKTAKDGDETKTALERVPAHLLPKVYADLAEAIASYRQALVLWPGNEEAKQGERLARIGMARAALEAGDLGLAEVQAAAFGEVDPESARLITEGVRRRRAEIEAAAWAAEMLKLFLGVAVVVAIAALTVGFVLVRRERDRAEESAVEARRNAETARAAERDAKGKLARSLLAEGDALEQTGRTSKARERFQGAREALHDLGLPPFPADLGIFAADRRAPRPLAVIEVTGTAVRAAALSPDRPHLLLATADGRLVTQHRATGRELASTRVLDVPADHLAVSSDGSRALLASESGVARAVDVAAGTPLAVMGAAGGPAIHACSVSTDGRTGILAREDGAIVHVDLESGREIGRLASKDGKTHDGAVLDAFISPDGTYVYSGGADGTARHWHLASHGLVWAWKGVKAPVRAVALTHEGFLLAGADDRTLRLDRVRTGLEEGRLEPPGGPVTRIAMTPDLKTAVVASQDRTLRVYDVGPKEGAEARPLIRSLDDPEGPSRSLSISEDGALLVAVGRDGKARLHDLARARVPGEAGVEVRVHARPAVKGPVLLLANGAVALTAGDKGALHIRDAWSGRVLREVAPSGEAPASLLPRAGGEGAYAVYRDGGVAVIDVAGGPARRLEGAAARELLAPLAGLTERSTAAALSPDGTWALTGSADGTVRLEPVSRDAKKDAQRWPLGRHDAPVRGVAFLPGPGRYAASAGEDGAVRIFDLDARDAPEGAQVRALPAPGPVTALSALGGADGPRLLLGLADGRLALMDLGRPGAARALEASPGDPAARGRLLAHRGAFDLAAEALADATGQPLTPDPLAPLERAALAWERGDLLGAGRAIDAAIAEKAGPAWLLEARRARIAQDLERGGSLVGRAQDLLRDVALSPDGAFAFAAGREPLLRAFSLAGALEPWNALLPNELYTVAVSPDGREVAAGGRGEEVILVEAGTGRISGRVTLTAEPLRAVAYADGGRLLVAVAYEGPVRAFDRTQGLREVAAITVAARVTALAVSASGTAAYAGTREGALQAFDLARPEEAPRRIETGFKDDSLDDVRLLPGERRALVRTGWILRLLDLASGAAVRDLGDGHVSMNSLAVSPDGRLAATGSSEGKVHVFDVETGAAVAILSGHEAYVSGVAFTPDGRVIVSCSTSGEVRAHLVPPLGR